MASFACRACGYVTDMLFLGRGGRDSQPVRMLVSCASCKTLRVVDPDQVRRGCHKHRKPFVIYAEGADVPCPRCAASLAFTSEGIWD